MSSAKELLLLHLSQAEQALDRAKNNSYSDQQKQQYQVQLTELFAAVRTDALNHFSTLTDTDIYDVYKKHLDFIFKSLEFLDSSTLNQIPYEVVECLNHAMREWLAPTDQYIIVTSLVNDFQNFSYEGWVAFDDDLYLDIRTRYNIEFPHRLVQVNLPKAFSRDYLALVVLYHELGHFVDFRHALMHGLIDHVLDKIRTGQYTADQLAEIQNFFPILSGYISIPDPKPILLSNHQALMISLFHLREYFCDLFAAQYIGEASNHYLTYITTNQPLWSSSHPSTINRVKVVTDYLSGISNIVVDMINEALTRVRATTIQRRFTTVAPDDFYNLVPVEPTTIQEVHGLIGLAWSIWLTGRSTLGSKLNNGDSTKVYKVLNNLVEKSIGNYVTVNKWKETCARMNKTLPTLDAPSPSWSKRKIEGCLGKKDMVDLIYKGKLFIRPLLAADQVGQIGIDFRLGYDFLVSIQGREPFINASKNSWIGGGVNRNILQFFQSTRRQIGETFILHPHQTVLAVSLEYVKIPEDCILHLFMRSSYSRLGITVSTIAQPGYTGCLSLELTNNNNNPINLAVGARILQGVLQKISSPSNYFHNSRKYVCQVRPEPSAVINDDDLIILNQLWEENNNRATTLPTGGTP